MTMTDPIADFLTIIRNANSMRMDRADAPLSKIKVGVAAVLKEEGFIEDFEVVGDENKKKLRIQLKYGEDGERVIRKIQRESKPGRRVYRGVDEVKKVLNGMGVGIYSTPQGVLSDRKCREGKVGGEFLCTVY